MSEQTDKHWITKADELGLGLSAVHRIKIGEALHKAFCDGLETGVEDCITAKDGDRLESFLFGEDAA